MWAKNAVSTTTYGSTGSAKSSISINGIKTGWARFSGGNPDNGSVGVSFDSVPMSNPGNGLWQATLVPQTSLLQTVNVACSFNTSNLSFDYQTGDIGGWQTVIAGGLNHADSFLKAPDGFANNTAM